VEFGLGVNSAQQPGVVCQQRPIVRVENTARLPRLFIQNPEVLLQDLVDAGKDSSDGIHLYSSSPFGLDDFTLSASRQQWSH
jgi:hypothetical protein